LKSVAGTVPKHGEGNLSTQLGHASERTSISQSSDDQQRIHKDDFNNTGLPTDQQPQMAELKGEDFMGLFTDHKGCRWPSSRRGPQHGTTHPTSMQIPEIKGEERTAA
jgi:hypothetical protein